MRGWVVGLIATALAVFVAGGIVIAVLLGGGTTPIVDLEPGDCFDLPDDVGDEIVAVETVECAEPHLAEVVSIGELRVGDEPYPAGDDLVAVVDEACRRAGVVDSADFGLLPIAPTEALWESYQGRFLCVAIPFGGEPVTGSIVAG